MSNKLQKTAAFSDIHWGRKAGSEQHNQDCLDYINWFCEQVKKHNIDNIMFLGDWFETRSSINISTLNYSYTGAKKLNELGIPIYFVIGNHDLYYRHNREIYSTLHFESLTNFRIIDSPTIINDIETNPVMFPYLFHHEYSSLGEYLNHQTWWGHFEFQGFIVTGQTVTMKSGPNHTLFKGPKYIFSGHFHKRQQQDNICFIGNTFPMDFSDAGDIDRGFMVYDHVKQTVSFENWPDCPKYYKTKLSTLLDNNVDFGSKARVNCMIDLPINFEEHAIIKNQYTTDYSLRDFVAEEALEIKESITEDGTIIEDEDASDDTTVYNVDDLVIKMLNSIDTDHIDNELLIQEYNKL